MLDVRRLQVLIELDEHGSFSAAAEALHLTQSAVSQHVAALEREVGLPVVERSTRPIGLTEAACAAKAFFAIRSSDSFWYWRRSEWPTIT